MRFSRYQIALGAATILILVASCKDIVAPPAVATITISDKALDLVSEETEQLTATPRESAGNALVRTIAWSSSAPEVATVNNGLVTAISTGAAVITASSDGVTATADVVVDDGGLISPAGNLISVFGGKVVLQVPASAVSQAAPAMLSVAESPPPSSRLLPGTAISLRIQAPLTQAAVLTMKYDPALVLASPQSGLRMFKAEGSRWQALSESGVDLDAKTVHGRITDAGIYAILLQAAVAKIAVSPDSKTVKAGDTLTFKTTLQDADGADLTDRPISWTSSAPVVVQVDAASGVAVARSPGTAVVTAQAEGKSANAAVTVTPGDATRISIQSGDQQVADTSAAVAIAPSVKVTDGLGFNVSAVTVT